MPQATGGNLRTDNQRLMYDPTDGRTLTTFHGDAWFTEPIVSPDGETIAVGDKVGRVLFLRWRGPRPG